MKISDVFGTVLGFIVVRIHKGKQASLSNRNIYLIEYYTQDKHKSIVYWYILR